MLPERNIRMKKRVTFLNKEALFEDLGSSYEPLNREWDDKMARLYERGGGGAQQGKNNK